MSSNLIKAKRGGERPFFISPLIKAPETIQGWFFSWKAVLAGVAELLNTFVHRVLSRRTPSKAPVNAAKIFTFGSYRLGVHGPDTDIDVLCVVPEFISRDFFFVAFEAMLRSIESITEVSKIEEAHVPLIKAKISGIHLDILCACFEMSSIPEDLELKDDKLLLRLDPRCARSLGGPRVADEILRLVPNVQVFRDSLRCIKSWAQRRAIYSYVRGFLGGVAWAILVARVCQLFPRADAGAIVHHFFVTAYHWPWPQPVLLRSIESGPSHFRVWNPKQHDTDQSHRMPIITPAYPAVCSTRTVTTSTKLVMTAEFKRGIDVVDKVMRGTGSWSELFANHDFFRKYEYYIEIVASTRNPGLVAILAREVERRMRNLVIKLENTDPAILAHSFPRRLHRNFHSHPDSDRYMAVTGGATEVYTGDLHSTAFFIGLAIQSNQGGSVGPDRTDISTRLTEFTKLVHAWAQFDEDSMRLDVQHVNRVELPNYVSNE